MNYQDYHQHPVNKFLHTFCIPIIVLTTINFLSILQKKYDSLKGINYSIFILLSIYYLFNYNVFIFLVMNFYFMFMFVLSDMWIFSRKKYLQETFILFISAWILQFFGHYIEGNRPALFDSIITSFTQAPLYSLNNIFRLLD